MVLPPSGLSWQAGRRRPKPEFFTAEIAENAEAYGTGSSLMPARENRSRVPRPAVPESAGNATSPSASSADSAVRLNHFGSGQARDVGACSFCTSQAGLLSSLPAGPPGFPHPRPLADRIAQSGSSRPRHPWWFGCGGRPRPRPGQPGPSCHRSAGGRGGFRAGHPDLMWGGPEKATSTFLMTSSRSVGISCPSSRRAPR